MSSSITYDAEVDALAIMIRRRRTVVETRELAPGILADFAEDGQLVCLEILDASRRVGAPLLKRMAPHPPGRLLLADAAERIGVTAATLRQQIHRGRLTAAKVGRDWYVTPAEVARYQRVVSRGDTTVAD